MPQVKKYVGEIAATVYQTNDYSIFRVLNGNRSVLTQRKRIILTSIKERGFIMNPIVVNEKMEIIDGQGRFEALRELDMPIYYIVAVGATIDDCIALNIKQKNWSLNDYIHCYAEIGNDEYIFLEKLLHKYHGKLHDNVIVHIAGISTADSTPSSKIKNGEFRIMDRDTIDKRMEFAMSLSDIIGTDKGRSRLWGCVFKFLYYTEEIDKKTLMHKLTRRVDEIPMCGKVKDAILRIEDVYNFKTESDNKVFFQPLFEKYKKMCRNLDKVA